MGFNRVDTSHLKEKIAKMESESSSRSGGGGSENRWFRLPKEKSKTKIRFLPPVGKMTDYGKKVQTHFSLPLKEVSQIKCFQTYGMHCPLCELLDKYRNKFKVDDWEPALQTYFNVLVQEISVADRNGTMVAQQVEHVGLPQLLSFYGDYTLIWLMKEIDEGGDITDPMQGYDVVFERTKYGGKFDRRVMREATPIAQNEQAINAIAESAYDLEGDTFRPPSEEYIKRMQQVCAAVQKTCEEKLMPLQQQNTIPAQQPTNYNAPPQQPSQPVQQAYQPQPTQQMPVQPVAAPPVGQQQVQQPIAQSAPPPIENSVPSAPAVQQQGFNATGNPPPTPMAAPANGNGQQQVAGAPPNAPACFGDPATYNPQGSQKCMICHVEFDCQRVCASKAAAPAANPNAIPESEIPFQN